jgi:hypothetical protein
MKSLQIEKNAASCFRKRTLVRPRIILALHRGSKFDEKGWKWNDRANEGKNPTINCLRDSSILNSRETAPELGIRARGLDTADAFGDSRVIRNFPTHGIFPDALDFSDGTRAVRLKKEHSTYRVKSKPDTGGLLTRMGKRMQTKILSVIIRGHCRSNVEQLFRHGVANGFDELLGHRRRNRFIRRHRHLADIDRFAVGIQIGTAALAKHQVQPERSRLERRKFAGEIGLDEVNQLATGDHGQNPCFQ